MASWNPACAHWWYQFIESHGRDSEEESAFLGYLTTQSIDPHGSVPALDAAYAAFRLWWDASMQAPGG